MSKTVTIDWPESEWQALIESGTKAITRACELFVADFWGNLREEAPVDQGRLAGSFLMDKVSDTQWKIVSGVIYAVPVWKGSKPHVILPRNKKALFWPGANHPVKRVNHPGNPPNPFVERAWDRAENRTADFVAMALREAGLAA